MQYSDRGAMLLPIRLATFSTETFCGKVRSKMLVCKGDASSEVQDT
jgi:hypothetical protein